MAKKQTLNAGYTALIGSPLKQDAPANNPVGVVLTPEAKARLTEIAAELHTNRHKLMQYIIAEWLQRYEAGKRPRMKKITRAELDT